VCMVGLVIIRARHSAKIRAKSLIVSEKTIVIIAYSRTYAVKRQFLTKILPSGKLHRSDTQEQSMLFDSN
jgi:hypothetical protein